MRFVQDLYDGVSLSLGHPGVHARRMHEILLRISSCNGVSLFLDHPGVHAHYMHKMFTESAWRVSFS